MLCTIAPKTNFTPPFKKNSVTPSMRDGTSIILTTEIHPMG